MPRHNEKAQANWDIKMERESVKGIQGQKLIWLTVPFHRGTMEYAVIQVKVAATQDGAPDRNRYKLSFRFNNISQRSLDKLVPFFHDHIGNKFLSKIQESDVVSMDTDLILLPAAKDKRFPQTMQMTKSWDVIIYPFKSKPRAEIVIKEIKEILRTKFIL